MRAIPGAMEITRIPAEDLAARQADLLAPDASVWAGTGWRPIIDEALAALAGHPVVVTAVRDHGAGLRLGVRPREAWTDEAYAVAGRVVDSARDRSRETCEACGAPGRPRIPGPGVRCDAHATER
ncbi:MULTISPECIES: hypothetical protein [Methylobacteriaceae]|uniref:Uncharacterized protein n=1 Tax=Methylorubrum thiocyanatum TaxID=47958 RepID=A0AA40S5X7_9HYPH|nr:hypothetical protein [Methylorubrum thiocyanatum]MBA8915064.1 hypothetical protein [Methylorubrum thiocyanatum]